MDAETSARSQAILCRVRVPQLRAAHGKRRGPDSLERARPREQESLTGHASKPQQLRHLLLLLDALGNGLEAERFTEHHDGAGNIRAIAGFGEAGYER